MSGTVTVDRRAQYYQRVAELIAADPLGFYARAERGRRIQSRFPWMKPRSTALTVVPVWPQARRATP